MTQETGIISEIAGGHGEVRIFGFKILSVVPTDMIYILRHNTNRLPFLKYKRLGTIEVARPHTFREGDVLNVATDNKKITAIEKVGRESTWRYMLHNLTFSILIVVTMVWLLYIIWSEIFI